MKVWIHIGAALVGLAMAGLIVFLVFGSASRQGAVQEGAAPGANTGENNLCGSIKPQPVVKAAQIEKASKNLPSIVNERGIEVAISPKRPDQLAWFGRIQAAGGFCVDEIKISDDTTSISMSTVKGLTNADAAAFAGAAMVAANLPPLHREHVSIVMTSGGKDRKLAMSSRAWNAFNSKRLELGLGTTVKDFQRFQRGSNFKSKDVEITGWS